MTTKVKNEEILYVLRAAEEKKEECVLYRSRAVNKIHDVIFERMQHLVNIGQVEQEDEDEICISMPFAIYDYDDDDNLECFIFLTAKKSQYSGYWFLHLESRGEENNSREGFPVTDYDSMRDLYQNLERMGFWDVELSKDFF